MLTYLKSKKLLCFNNNTKKKEGGISKKDYKFFTVYTHTGVIPGAQWRNPDWWWWAGGQEGRNTDAFCPAFI